LFVYFKKRNFQNNYFFLKKKEHQTTGPCASNPCQNGGICIAEGDSFRCECQGQYTGPRCQACIIYFLSFFYYFFFKILQNKTN